MRKLTGFSSEDDILRRKQNLHDVLGRPHGSSREPVSSAATARASELLARTTEGASDRKKLALPDSMYQRGYERANGRRDHEGNAEPSIPLAVERTARPITMMNTSFTTDSYPGWSAVAIRCGLVRPRQRRGTGINSTGAGALRTTRWLTLPKNNSAAKPLP